MNITYSSDDRVQIPWRAGPTCTWKLFLFGRSSLFLHSLLLGIPSATPHSHCCQLKLFVAIYATWQVWHGLAKDRYGSRGPSSRLGRPLRQARTRAARLRPLVSIGAPACVLQTALLESSCALEHARVFTVYEGGPLQKTSCGYHARFIYKTRYGWILEDNVPHDRLPISGTRGM